MPEINIHADIKNNDTPCKSGAGFTLIELLIAAGIFSIIALFATGSLTSVFNSNRKANSLQAVMTNLNFALEEMSREIRFGTDYRCASSGTNPSNCPSGGSAITFKFDADADLDDEQVTYQFVDSDSDGDFEIERKVGTGSFEPISSDDVRITYARFFVTGAEASNAYQPRITVVIHAVAGSGDTESEFTIQNTLVQRKEKY
ncbi:MAG: hypothetical protein COV34_00200 [Candidatus Zambryskibacteria bacterium CG10_big_fil_rev_8_21_14_0_10_42_12]|uniref:Prepilin-type N-terminal cleavage/methylation domain-containing protein n=1 Tax=Candidatus Zambryskibacteria bacterium CG10_big_fil_rev_8_21_14_0_10_42_12 TaxID=1975115 RepID=A0A2H0QX56_9BACT|nr:MAG: hypothetical protein COV34_00200 [Candidatus Zambryskibacteria bacterium CG10_big_fil_rev_8_21_14_0_10_42_12]